METKARPNWLDWGFRLLLLLLIAAGIFFRFYRRDWNDGADLHPDEYGLTNTISQLSLPQTWDDYFNTRLSPISPYARYDDQGATIGNGPDQGMRWGQWPIILIRSAAELTNTSSYSALRLTGRSFSAALDTLCLLLVYLIGSKLYGAQIGLLAAALSSLTVLQIQGAHFMTVDSFATFFATLAMYMALRIAGQPFFSRSSKDVKPNTSFMATRISASIWGYTLGFGVAFGMALASKINLLPLFGLLPLAFILSASRPYIRKPSLQAASWRAVGLTFLALCAVLVVFRLTQPMSFRAPTGNTSVFTLNPNPDWLANIRAAAAESGGAATAPPAEQWTDRPAILFPLMNMVLWGMGLPLGLAAWAGFALALWQAFKLPGAWRQHLLPLVWGGGFFFFMATRWVKSIRYFLPIYPFFAIFAAFLLFWVLRQPFGGRTRAKLPAWLRALPLALVLAGSLAYSGAFVHAVYRQENTRVTASRWIYANLPAPIQLDARGAEGGFKIRFALGNGTALNGSMELPFISQEAGVAEGLRFAHLLGPEQAGLTVELLAGGSVIGSAAVELPGANNPKGDELFIQLPPVVLTPGQAYTLRLTSSAGLTINRNTILVEDWDEGLPFRMDGHDPYGMYYNGLILPNRWGDRPEKLAVYLDYLEQADLVAVSSQRAIWSISRLPKMYPLTIRYYRALFDGRLGFDLALHQQRPFKFGPLQVSDLAGTAAWGSAPQLPLFNFNPLAAEEAFSVYDHAPVWLFKKGAGFESGSAAAILGSVDLSKIEIQIPSETTLEPFR